jgi:hypothetical protein
VTTNPIANFPDFEFKVISAVSFKIILVVIQINYCGPVIKKEEILYIHVIKLGVPRSSTKHRQTTRHGMRDTTTKLLTKS